jgi:hypothetical protein
VITCLLVFAVLVLLPSIATYDLFLGQADLLVAALAVGAEGLRLRRHPAAPLALGAAIAIKPVLLPLLAVWAWKRDWRSAFQGLAAAAALLLAPFLVAGGVTALHDYTTFLTTWNGLNGSTEYINQAIYGVVLRALTANPYTTPLLVAPGLVAPMRYGLVLAATGLWLWSVPRRPSADRALALAEYLTALPLVLLASPLSEDIHYCLLLPVLAGLVCLAVARGWLRRPAGWALCGCLILFCIPRMHELIYPTHLLVLPGQHDVVLGPAITLVRTSILCLIAATTLVAGCAALRYVRAIEERCAPVPVSQPFLMPAPVIRTRPLSGETPSDIGESPIA